MLTKLQNLVASGNFASPSSPLRRCVWPSSLSHKLFSASLYNRSSFAGNSVSFLPASPSVSLLPRRQLRASLAARDYIMATTACFIIVSRNDIPIYEAEVGVAAKREDAAQLHQFILHAALDIVQDLAWTTSAMYLKSVDRFNDLVVSVYVSAGHTRFMLLHDSRNDDGIKSFFQDVHELYIKTLLNPLYLPGSRITSSHFDTKVRALARKYL